MYMGRLSMRQRITLSVEYDLNEKLKKLSELTRIPASRLFDEAVEDLLVKHNYEKLIKDKKKK